MTETPDRRCGPRIKTGVTAYFSSSREEGSAVVAEISPVGARLEKAWSRPGVSAQVGLSLFLPSSSKRLKISGRVVRHTKDGFAIEYERPNPHICDLVSEDVAPVTPGERAETEGRDEVTPASEDEPEALIEALELIIAVALDGRQGSVEPEEALDTIIERAREMLETAKTRSTLKL